MIRSVRTDGRIDSGGAFSPILRPRVLERLEQAASARVTLLVAPAGYGKSVALRQYLEAQGGPHARYGVRAENASLLGFVRGLADALLEVAPAARKTASGAYEKCRSSPTPGADLAAWMHAHIKTYNGLIAIDDLHLTDGDPEVTKFLVALIERTKGRARWMIASRSTLDLPVASWLAYGEIDLTVDDQDLRFTPQEGRQLAEATRVRVRDDEIERLVAMTEGWPTALSFALRASMRSLDLRNISASTREMVYDYLAEQVYASLSNDERDLLHLAVFLPEIDVEVLHRAGYDRALGVVEELRDRVAFITAERPGVFRCHDLFRDFVRHQFELRGAAEVTAMRLRVAELLEGSDQPAGALRAYAEAGAAAQTLRLLESHGFDLMEQAHGDAVHAAIGSLSRDTRATHPAVLALRACNECATGRLDRADVLFQRAASLATDVNFRARVAINYAVMLITQARDLASLLEPFADVRLDADLRGEIVGLLADSYAYLGPREKAELALGDALRFAQDTDSEVVRAKALYRVAFACLCLDRDDEARECASRSADVCIAEGLLGLAARSYGLLAILTARSDDLTKSLWYAQQSAATAAKAGDRIARQTALLSVLEVEAKRGNWERMRGTQKLLKDSSTTDALRATHIVCADAMLCAIGNDFDAAYRAVAPLAGSLAADPGRAIDAAFAALYALAAGERERALSYAGAIVAQQSDNGKTRPARVETEMALWICALVEALAGRVTVATRVVARESRTGSRASAALRDLCRILIGAARSPALSANSSEALRRLEETGHRGYGELIQVVWQRVHAEGDLAHAGGSDVLTKAELEVLRALDRGRKPKEIALESGRSVFTVQAHIRNLIGKLHSSGRTEALAAARKSGILG